MRTFLLIAFLALACFFLNALSIHDIQYTTNAGSGTYPSLYAGQTVSTSGVVVAHNYNGTSGYFISSPEGGAWNGIFIYDSSHSPNLGDMVQITGQVWEYYGWTEIRSVSNYQTISTGNPLPQPTVLTVNGVLNEAYESVLVQLYNVTTSQTLNQYGEWMIADTSGQCLVAGGFFDQNSISNLIQIGNSFDSIIGMINYSYSNYRVNPRTLNDITLSSNSVVITLPNILTPPQQQITVPINVTSITMTQGFTSYQGTFNYNPNVLQFQDLSTAGTISSNGTAYYTNNIPGSFNLNFICNGFITGQGTLINLCFFAQAIGSSTLTLSSFCFNDTQINNILPGNVAVYDPNVAIGDTITVIQRPLLNIPAIVVPGETMPIECTAPANTTAWAASLKYRQIEIPLSLTSSTYLNNPDRWVLQAVIPPVNLYELYDLQVTASGGISDITQNAVQVIPQRKTNYYFAHITDAHLPTHLFWGDSGYDTDTTEVEDFREVIKDINLIRPEFVLFTGDLVNSGEMEDFENQRWFSKAQQLLNDFEVPVYLTTGNHDVGGWVSTPPPSGTSRRDWFRFFGWSWLNNANVAQPYHTQDYSFDYGQIHFTGLDAYDNYDSYLPLIYGPQSFTQNQLQWLQADLSASTLPTKVLFYHYDFSEQLNLAALNVAMGLWGHIHYSSGSITQIPYNLSTRATCDGYRAYRIINVQNSTVQPLESVSAGSNGMQINVTYNPNNYGYSTSVTASITNNQPITFANAIIRFNMPAGNSAYVVNGGTLTQVDRSGQFNVCYVNVNLTANSTRQVTIMENGTSLDESNTNVTPLYISAPYPNPFRLQTNIKLSNLHSKYAVLSIYNIKGEMVYKNHLDTKALTEMTLSWNGCNKQGNVCPKGIYIAKIKTERAINTYKIIKLY